MRNKFYHKLAKWSLDWAFRFQSISDKCMEHFNWSVRNGYFELPYTLEEIEANRKAEEQEWEEFQKFEQRRNRENHRS